MLLRLSVLMLLLGGYIGNGFNNSLEYIYTDFANKIEEFLESKDTNISFLCNEHLTQYVRGLKLGEKWAMNVFDANAKFPLPGILDGNLVDLGFFDECLSIEQKINDVQVFGKYCIGEIQLKTKFNQIPKFSALRPESSVMKFELLRDILFIYLAKCFPDGCSAGEMEKVYAKIGIETTFKEDLCQTKNTQPKIDGGAIAVISVFGAILCLIFISTVYDVIFYYLKKEPAHSMLVAFSALENGAKLLKTSNSSSEIFCLHGIRVISMMSIIMFHKYYTRTKFPVKNYFYFYKWPENKANMFVMAGNLPVEAFFLLSGLLVSYSYMGAMAKGNKFNIITYYIRRYLRLTPVVVVVMVFHITLVRHVGSGPLYPSSTQTELINGCETCWWKTLLYIQFIFTGEHEICIPPAWYISTDMQLYILSPLFFIPLRKWPRITLLVICFFALCSLIDGFLVSWFFELYSYGYRNVNIEVASNYFWYYYTPIHTRASGWLIGMILGYFIFKSKEGKSYFPKNKAVVLILWSVSLGIIYVCTFAAHGLIVEEYSRLKNTLYNGLARPGWALAIAWIIYACVNGYGGCVNWFLSLPIFQVVSKLTYTLYLIHYPVMFIITAQMRTTTPFNTFQLMYTFWGDYAFSLVISMVVALAIEFPMAEIDRLLFGKREIKNKSTLQLCAIKINIFQRKYKMENEPTKDMLHTDKGKDFANQDNFKTL